MSPSEFCVHPYDSKAANWEAEQVALNIMIILARTGNKFRKLTWEEYVTERTKDGDNNIGSEHPFFDQVIEVCTSGELASAFSYCWRQAKSG